MSGIKFGEIDATQILDNEYKIKLIMYILGYILDNNQNINKPSQEQIEKFKEKCVNEMKTKYPNSGISLT